MSPSSPAIAARRRVAVITNLIPDYRFPIFASLQERRDLEWRVILSLPLERSCDIARQQLSLHYSTTNHLWMSMRHAKSGAVQREPMPIPLQLYQDLLAYRPDAIIAGEWGLRSLVCLAAARRLRIPLLIWSEEIASSAAGRTSLHRMVRRLLAKQVDAVLGWGEPAVDYARSIGTPAAAVHCVPQAADNAFWIDAATRIDRLAERRRLGINGTAFLFVGRLIQRKGAQAFIEAWRQLRPDLHERAVAIVVGTGEAESELRAQAAASGLQNIVFAGFRGGSELACYYAAVDYVVVPSLEDVWGFAANEALCFGRPVLGSCFAGSTQGLVAQAGVGEVIDPTDIGQFAARMNSWIETPPQIDADRCRAAIARMTYTDAAQSIQSALDSVWHERDGRRVQ